MKTRVKNRVWLKKDLPESYQRHRIKKLIHILNECFIRSVLILKIDDFDKELYKIIDINTEIKIKEFNKGMWMLRFPPNLGYKYSILYVFEPKSKSILKALEEEAPKWLKTTSIILDQINTQKPKNQIIRSYL